MTGYTSTAHDVKRALVKEDRRIKRTRKAQDRARHNEGDTYTEPKIPLTKKERSLKAKAKKDIYWLWVELGSYDIPDVEEAVFRSLLNMVHDDHYHRVERDVFRKELWKMALN